MFTDYQGMSKHQAIYGILMKIQPVVYLFIKLSNNKGVRRKFRKLYTKIVRVYDTIPYE